jgi:uncharacterized membrane protein YfhO
VVLRQLSFCKMMVPALRPIPDMEGLLSHLMICNFCSRTITSSITSESINIIFIQTKHILLKFYSYMIHLLLWLLSPLRIYTYIKRCLGIGDNNFYLYDLKIQGHHCIWPISLITFCCYTNLPQFEVHRFYLCVLQLILGFYSPYLDMMLQSFSSINCT